ncbi:hypothetical protein SISNIDRAFT_469135 [Sistotremastrum niveocremeum HHB9708]|uniref:Uncharacterized protein n=1 Tax=Sistotremastrum niveocremeum HHB9708 TaxID=1314777 RepID=A0A164QFV5_9AGAM|nr:hypothetical protein SISNIDRAFT_469135 [Sistotremastrum niveocremeum HHB9708]
MRLLLKRRGRIDIVDGVKPTKPLFFSPSFHSSPQFQPTSRRVSGNLTSGCPSVVFATMSAPARLAAQALRLKTSAGVEVETSSVVLASGLQSLSTRKFCLWRAIKILRHGQTWSVASQNAELPFNNSLTTARQLVIEWTPAINLSSCRDTNATKSPCHDLRVDQSRHLQLSHNRSPNAFFNTSEICFQKNSRRCKKDEHESFAKPNVLLLLTAPSLKSEEATPPILNQNSIWRPVGNAACRVIET